MVVFADQNIPFIQDALDGKANVRNVQRNDFSRDNLIKNKVEAIFVRSTCQVNSELLEKTKVKFVATSTSGIDHIDTDYLAKKSIRFYSAPGCNANSVAEFVIFSILKWNLLTNKDLSKCKIGIIGFGNIGKLVAEYSKRLGLEVWINDPPLLKANYVFPENTLYRELESILNECDIITNHVPLIMTGDFPTYYLINKKNFTKVKEESLFIHTSRGGVVEEAQLENLLKKKRIHLSIDVWENEPKFNSHIAKNSILCLPHIAGYSYDAKLKGALAVLNGFAEFSGIQPDTGSIEEQLKLNKRPLLDFSYPISIFKILRIRRAFETDVHNFLEFVDNSDDEKEKAFIMIRKNYPKRRESLYIEK
jgi:erythronate-4-phosphate dehydrogenase